MTAITITDAAHDYLADLLSKQNTSQASASASLSPSPRHPIRRDVYCLLQAR